MTAFDHHTILVGSYAPASEPGVHILGLEPDGALTYRYGYAGIERPSFLIADRAAQRVYVTGENDDGTVHALRLTTDPAGLTALGAQRSGGAWPCHLRLSRHEDWLVVSNYGGGSAGVLPVLDDGALGELTDLVYHEGRGPNPERQEGPHAHSATFSPDGQFAVVADLGTDQLVVYWINPREGMLLPHSVTAARPGAGPRHMLFHPNGQLAYVANELDCTVSVYAWDGAAGTLTELTHAATLPPDAPPTTVADIQIDGAANRLYVSNRGHDSIAVFEIGTGLRRTALLPSGGKTPRNFAVIPGRGLIVANQESDLVCVLRPDGTVIGSLALQSPSCIQVIA